MPDHTERPPTALAHGVVKGSDIERVRRDVDDAQARVADDDRASAARRRRRLRGRKTEREANTQSSVVTANPPEATTATTIAR